MNNERQIRRRGWVLVMLGGLLVVGMVTLLIVVTPIMLLPTPERANRFSGDTQDAILIFSILYVVITFGLASLFAGVSQIRHGRRSRKLAYVLLVLALVLYVLGMVVLWLG